MNKYKLSVFIFTRDLRLHDNTCLIKALKESELIIPIFILNSDQLTDTNKYKSDNCVQFMCECLIDLNSQLEVFKSRLFLFYGTNKNIVEKLISKNKINAVYITKDYTPFAKNRENELKILCDNNKIDFISIEDYLLTGINKVLNTNGEQYVKFTPFFIKAKNIEIKKDIKNNNKNYISSKNKFSNEFIGSLTKFYKENKDISKHGGREKCLKILKDIKKFSNYDNTRDYPFKQTTELSAYLKFNVVSIREVYWKLKTMLPENTKLIQQLYWRDFYMLIMYNFNVINNNMNGHKIKWKNNKKIFEKWTNGLTGFPIVDAGMRQLNKTGYMHNRLRMIVGSFLVKILHIDWKFGETYFASKLIDYDPSNNNGGWQWVASTGTDSQPYFRYFNPWKQSEKYDSNAEYIKKWIPELENVENKDIHEWYNAFKNDKYKKLTYSKPIINNINSKIKESIEIYKSSTK